MPEPVFTTNSFVGNLGAPLRATDEDVEDEDEKVWGTKAEGGVYLIRGE